MLNTATLNAPADEVLTVSPESTTHVMSGVYGLCWFPSGPRVTANQLL